MKEVTILTNVTITLKSGKTKTVEDLLKITKNDSFTDTITNFDDFSFSAVDTSPFTFAFSGKTSMITVAEKELVSIEFNKQN